MSEAKMPKTEDKTPCEVCGEMVTTHKGGRASHMRKHSEVESKPEAPSAALSVADGANDEEKAIIARAIAAEENFRKAPDVFLSEDTSDGNIELVKMYAPDCLDKFSREGKLLERAKRKAFFSSRENLARWAARGYVPVRGDNGALVTNGGGDVLTSCDRRISDSREAMAQNESREMVRTAVKNLDHDKVEGTDDASISDLRNTSVEVSQEEIAV